LVAFVALRTYRSIWRFASTEDAWLLVKAAVLGGGLQGLAVLLSGWRSYPRSVLVITASFVLLGTAGMRLLARWCFRRRRGAVPPGGMQPVLIVGAGATGESIAREIIGSPDLGRALIGFLDDDREKIGATIHGAPVLGSVDRLPEVATAHRVREVILAIPKSSSVLMGRVATGCMAAGVKLKTLPSMEQLVKGEGKFRFLRSTNLEELLRREALAPNHESVARVFRGKRVLVTGAGGSIGSELCRQLIASGVEALVMVERAENALHEISVEIAARHPGATVTAALADVKHVPRMTEILRQTRPHVVFHAAAYKHVSILEDHPGEAVLNNVVGTRRLAELSADFGVEKFVFISTDKAVEPRNLLGATKKIGEMYLGSLNNWAYRRPSRGTSSPRFVVVRFGNVLGSAGSVVPLFQRQIENGWPITITDPEAARFLMTIPEAVHLVLESAGLSDEGDVFVLDMGEPVKVADLADDVIVSMGLSPRDVERRYLGLRAGEKLLERLWEVDEQPVRSSHPRVFAIRQSPRVLTEMRSALNELEDLAIRGEIERLLGRVHDLVPSYNPIHRRASARVAEAGDRHSILVVDDDVQMCEVIVDFLKQRYRVRVANSAGEARELIKEEMPDVMLLDVRLPDQDGTELCDALRKEDHGRDVPIIMMTGHVDERMVVRGLRAGADDYVMKPMSLDELSARIEAVLRRTGVKTR
jgi:FlaA1/EpsC-like NDP-sugar epimerase/ActR/RegA family two-component response regulator